jgi:hypothetical protein
MNGGRNNGFDLSGCGTHSRRIIVLKYDSIQAHIIDILWDLLYIVYNANILYEGLRLWDCPLPTKTLFCPWSQVTIIAKLT